MKLGLLAYGLAPQEVLATARLAEEFDHDSLWLVEDHWDSGPVPLAAACACVTSELEIGIGVMNPFTRHPSVLAMDYLALTELSKGRVVLGIGASAKSWIEQMGLEYRMPRTAVRESIELVRALLQGETITRHGAVFRTESIRLGRVPERTPPLYMGAMGQRSVETCGEVADGWVVSLLQPISYVTASRQRLLAGLESAGRSSEALEIIQYIPFSCSTDRATARARAKMLLAKELQEEMALYSAQEVVLASFRDYLASTSPEEYEAVIRELAHGAEPIDAIPENLLDELTIAGTPDDCTEGILEYRDAGVTGLAFLCDGVDPRETAELIGSIATDIRRRDALAEDR